MARKSIEQLRIDIDAGVYENVTGDVTGTALNDLMQDTVDTYAPGYGILQIPQGSPQVVALDGTWVDFTAWTIAPFNTAEFTPSAVTGIVTCNVPMVVRCTVSMSCAAASNEQLDVAFTPSATALPSGFFSTVQAAGTGQPVGINLTGLFDIAAIGETVKVQARSDTGGANWTFDAASFICELIPLLNTPVPAARINFG